MDWRLILDGDLPGHENMARDSSILASLEAGRGVPTVRVYGWSSPAISIGYLQDAAPFIGHGLPVVRRVTGGRAVVHSSEVTYSVTGLIDDPLFSGGVMAAYSVISSCIIAALKDCGVEADYSRGSAKDRRSEACFHSPSRYEVLIEGRKLVGSAQRRLRRAFIQHGSILMGLDEQINERVFGCALKARMASVAEFSTITRGELTEALIRRFAEGLGAQFAVSGLSGEEARESMERACLSLVALPARENAALRA